MWLDNIRDLKKERGVTNKWIAEATNLPERTVTRIFAGDTDNPYVDTLHRIVTVLGGSLDGILADTKMVVGGADMVALQADVDRLTAEVAMTSAENSVLKDKVAVLTAENDLLRLKLEHKEEIIAVHNYYIKMRPNE